MTTDILFGVHVPPEGRDFQEMQHICQSIESMGYDLFTITDHFMNMRNPEDNRNHPLECWTTRAPRTRPTLSSINVGSLFRLLVDRRLAAIEVTQMASFITMLSIRTTMLPLYGVDYLGLSSSEIGTS